MGLEEELQMCKHMWDGSEEWMLYRIEHKQIALTILFQSLQPSAQEMATVRRLLPKYRNLPVSQARLEFGTTGRLELKPLSNRHAAEVAKRGEQLGLRIETVQSSLISYLPVRSSGGAAHIIEDNALAQMVVAKMLAAGVPIVQRAY